MAKVYLDYNVWDKISKDEDTKAFFTEMKEKGWSYYLSVAHYEELFHAQNNETPNYSTVPKEQSISFMGKEWKIQYGSENDAQELAYRYVHGMSQEIKRNSYIDIHSDYFRLEYVIERLCNILLLSGHKRDSTQRTYVSGAYDTQHIIMSTYCDLFITMDKKLAEKYKAIAYYLGIPIQVQRWDINQHKIV